MSIENGISETEEVDAYDRVDDFLSNLGAFYRPEVCMEEEYFSLKRSRVMSEINILMEKEKRSPGQDTLNNSSTFISENPKNKNQSSPISSLLNRRRNSKNAKIPVAPLKLQMVFDSQSNRSLTFNNANSMQKYGNLKGSLNTTDISSNTKSFEI